MTCVCFEGGKAKRECWIEWVYESDELRLLMAWSMDLHSLMMETEYQSS